MVTFTSSTGEFFQMLVKISWQWPSELPVGNQSTDSHLTGDDEPLSAPSNRVIGNTESDTCDGLPPFIG